MSSESWDTKLCGISQSNYAISNQNFTCYKFQFYTQKHRDRFVKAQYNANLQWNKHTRWNAVSTNVKSNEIFRQTKFFPESDKVTIHFTLTNITAKTLPVQCYKNIINIITCLKTKSLLFYLNYDWVFTQWQWTTWCSSTYCHVECLLSCLLQFLQNRV